MSNTALSLGNKTLIGIPPPLKLTLIKHESVPQLVRQQAKRGSSGAWHKPAPIPRLGRGNISWDRPPETNY